MRNNLNVGVGGEYIITEMLSNCIQNVLRQNVNVILDEVNCKLNYIEKYIFYFNKLTDIQFVYFDIPLQELKKRNTIRALETKTQPIPEKVIENAYNSFQDLKKQFNFELIKKIETPNVLERKKFIGGRLNPGNWFKYITRMMVAEDVTLSPLCTLPKVTAPVPAAVA